MQNPWHLADGKIGRRPMANLRKASVTPFLREMEMALGKYIESLLRETQLSSTGKAA